MSDKGLEQRIKACLEKALGERLEGVILYGSQARGQAAEDSDIDLLVLLRGPVALGKDLRKIISALYPIQLEVFRPIHAVPVNIQAYEAGDFALYRNAKQEGVVL